MSTAATSDFARILPILQQLDSMGSTPCPQERRHAPRMSLRTCFTAIVSSSSALVSLPIFCRNISGSGIGFVSRRPFQPFERLAISLKIEGFPSKLVLARIAYAHYIQGSYYHVGAEFIECINDPSGAASIPYWDLSLPAGESAK